MPTAGQSQQKVELKAEIRVVSLAVISPAKATLVYAGVKLPLSLYSTVLRRMLFFISSGYALISIHENFYLRMLLRQDQTAKGSQNDTLNNPQTFTQLLVTTKGVSCGKSQDPGY